MANEDTKPRRNYTQLGKTCKAGRLTELWLNDWQEQEQAHVIRCAEVIWKLTHSIKRHAFTVCLVLASSCWAFLIVQYIALIRFYQQCFRLLPPVMSAD